MKTLKSIIKKSFIMEGFTKKYKSPQEFTLDWSTKSIIGLLSKSGIKKSNEYWLSHYTYADVSEDQGYVFGFVYDKKASPSNNLSFMLRYKEHTFNIKWDVFLFLPSYATQNRNQIIELKDDNNQTLFISRDEIIEILNNLNRDLLNIKNGKKEFTSF